jgi:hypothetical protein
MKDAVRRIGNVPERHRVSGNALVSRPSARLGMLFFALAECIRRERLGDPDPVGSRDNNNLEDEPCEIRPARSLAP